MSEQQAEYLTDAMEMMGQGYAPAVTITPPTTEFAMGDEPGFCQTKTPAFIKLSTAFKKHMINLKGARLGIWLYIALSINDGGKAYPSIETIERDTGYSNRAIIDVIRELESLGYLSLKHRGGTSNLYTINGFAAIGKSQPSSELSSPVNFTTRGVNFTAESHEESSLKPDINQNIKPETTTTIETSKIFKIYESEIGPLTPIIAQEIGGYIENPKCPTEYIADAIHESARQNKRNWSYVRAILNRWMVEGKTARQEVPRGNHAPKQSTQSVIEQVARSR